MSPKHYVLQDLLRVRLLREDAAAREWGLQKEVVATVERELADQKVQLDEYKKWRVRREQELFEGVLNQKIHSKDLENLRFRIQQLRDKQADHELKILETKQRLEEEKQRLEESRVVYYETLRQREKLDEHKAAWMEEQSRVQEQREEAELEELTTAAGLAASWGE